MTIEDGEHVVRIAAHEIFVNSVMVLVVLVKVIRIVTALGEVRVRHPNFHTLRIHCAARTGALLNPALQLRATEGATIVKRVRVPKPRALLLLFVRIRPGTDRIPLVGWRTIFLLLG
jgi:hypothetical protein